MLIAGAGASDDGHKKYPMERSELAYTPCMMIDRLALYLFYSREVYYLVKSSFSF